MNVKISKMIQLYEDNKLDDVIEDMSIVLTKDDCSHVTNKNINTRTTISPIEETVSLDGGSLIEKPRLLNPMLLESFQGIGEDYELLIDGYAIEIQLLDTEMGILHFKLFNREGVV